MVTKTKLNDQEKAIVLEFNTLVASGSDEHNAKQVCADKFDISVSRVEHILYDNNKIMLSSPASLEEKAISSLEKIEFQMEERLQALKNIHKGDEYLQKMIENEEDFEKKMRLTLDRIVKLLDEAESDNPKFDKIKMIDSIRKQLANKYSPLGWGIHQQTLKEIVAESRKNNMAINGMMDSLVQSRKQLMFIQNNFFSFDPGQMNEENADKAGVWIDKVWCPHCPGYKAKLEAERRPFEPQPEPEKEERAIDVNYYDVKDEEKEHKDLNELSEKVD
jgi:glutaredoxin